MKQQLQGSDAVRSAAISRILWMREILIARFCILLAESACLFPGILLR